VGALFHLLSVPLVASDDGPQHHSPDSPGLPVLTRIEQIRSLPRAEAERGYPVKIHACVTFSDLAYQILFVQDASGPIFVDFPPAYNTQLVNGEKVLIEGVTELPDFAPNIKATTIQSLGRGRPPDPAPLSYEELQRINNDSKWAELDGVIRSFEITDAARYARQFWEKEISVPGPLNGQLRCGEAGAVRRRARANPGRARCVL